MPAAPLARPAPRQYAWQEQERIMFVCLDPCTWQGREYDNHSTPLDRINPARLDANQFCRVAKLWGAKELLLVAKHTGGFCWWQTGTSDYSVKKTPWRNGKGDLVREVADACREHGLALGIYVYPGDDTWGAPMGSGGRTRDPSKQEAYSKVFRQQMTEVLSRYGRIAEVWFDGSCVIEVGDIIRQHAPDAVVLQGPHATIRWPGTESGKLPYPVWSSLKSSDLKTGVATAQHDDPDGDAWAPHECDTTLYNHFWFWSANGEKHRKSLDELMDIYIKSVGRGGALLLNSTPNTDGLIPDGDVALYEAFGKEIDRCFGRPLAETNGVGAALELDLDRPAAIDSTVLMEDYREGHRIREYVIEGLGGSGWIKLATGSSVGRMKIDTFPLATVTRLRLRITNSAGEPLIRRLAAFHNGLTPTVALTAGKSTTASSTHSAPYAPSLATDGNPQTRWGAADSDTNAWLEVDLGQPIAFGKVVIKELADRIQQFVIEYRNDPVAPWQTAFPGGPAGDDYVHAFPAVTGRYARLRVARGGSLGPTIWEFQLWPAGQATWQQCGSWASGQRQLRLELNRFIPKPGQYEVRLDAAGGMLQVAEAKLLYEGAEATPGMLTRSGGNLFNVNRTAQVTGETSTVLVLALHGTKGAGTVWIRPRFTEQ
jgi:alpha-L-fucosidase